MIFAKFDYNAVSWKEAVPNIGPHAKCVEATRLESLRSKIKPRDVLTQRRMKETLIASLEVYGKES